MGGEAIFTRLGFSGGFYFFDGIGFLEFAPFFYDVRFNVSPCDVVYGSVSFAQGQAFFAID
jgi:hypothetical protein